MNAPHTRALVLLLGCALGSLGCASTYAERPYRFDIPASPYATTQLVAQRMSRSPDTTPTSVDPVHGVVYTAWRMLGAHNSLTVWPPGEDNEWILDRYRVTVQLAGSTSMVLIDRERLYCEKTNFRWDATSVNGQCQAETTVTVDDQQAIDALGARIAATP